MKTVKKPSRPRKFNRAYLFKKLPLLGFSVLEVAILIIVIGGGTAALVVQRTHKGIIKSQPDTTSTSQTPNSSPLNINTSQTKSTPTQSTLSTTKSSSATTTTNLPDADGCVPNTSGYQSCRTAAAQLKFMLQCDDDMKAANDSYYATYNPQWNSYNSDVNAKQQELNSLVGTEPGYTQGWADGIWLSYEHDRAQQFNSAVIPAYNTYVATYNKIVARGCNVVKTWTDPTLPF